MPQIAWGTRTPKRALGIDRQDKPATPSRLKFPEADAFCPPHLQQFTQPPHKGESHSCL